MVQLMSFIAFYVLLLAAFIFVMLFGECAAFEGTLVARANALLSGGLCSLGSRACVRVFGQRGECVLDSVTDRCFDRPNPALQARLLLARLTAGLSARGTLTRCPLALRS